MQLVRLIVVVLAGVAAAAGYIHEGRRLEKIRGLPGEEARDYYEAGRNRDERAMWMIAVALAAAAVVSVLRDVGSTGVVPGG